MHTRFSFVSFLTCELSGLSAGMTVAQCNALYEYNAI